METLDLAVSIPSSIIIGYEGYVALPILVSNILSELGNFFITEDSKFFILEQ